jgi:fructose-1,6-bisphosphatase I
MIASESVQPISSCAVDSVESHTQFPAVISAIVRAAKIVQSRVRDCAITGLLGNDGERNVHGEVQQRLDTFSNRIFINELLAEECVNAVVSEECEDPVLRPGANRRAGYTVVLDPLDGSSNIDINLNVGTIFAVFKSRSAPPSGSPWSVSSPLAAGYILYGPSTLLVYTEGSGVSGFTLDPDTGRFLLSHKNIRIPSKGSVYSCNEAYSSQFPDAYQRYLNYLKGFQPGECEPYSSRYSGALVADFHRILLKGGVFFYPSTVHNPNGKLRLVYEAFPLAFIAEQAGGKAFDGVRSIMTIVPSRIHQRTPLIIGGVHEMSQFLRDYAA